MVNVLIFAILQLFNVILSTIKTVIQIKGNKISATIANSVYYAFYTVVVIFMTSDFGYGDVWNIVIKVIVTFVSNLIGTYVGMSIMDHLRKDKLWKIEASVLSEYTESIHTELNNKQVKHSYIEHIGKYSIFNIYCETKEDSSIAKKVLKDFTNGSVKYFVSESKSLE